MQNQQTRLSGWGFGLAHYISLNALLARDNGGEVEMAIA